MSELINLIICVDDTDDLSKSTSTGAVAERIMEIVKDCGGLVSLGITRHQLLLAPGVNYTSHNSAMAFSARIADDSLDEIYVRSVEAINQMKADSADPGLCLIVAPEDDYEEYENIRTLLEFGQKAQTQVLTKEDAYDVALDIPWVSLTEHGGTGEGVIGALAGAALRLSGCDGRFRGRWDLRSLCCDGAGAITNAKDARNKSNDCAIEEDVAALPAFRVLDAMSAQVNGAVALLDVNDSVLDPSCPISLVRDAKPVLRGNALTVYVQMHDGLAWPCSKDQLGDGLRDKGNAFRSCEKFVADNDEEEMAGTDVLAPICPNCLYRRWTAQGFSCMKREG